jgi:hypothetical protein
MRDILQFNRGQTIMDRFKLDDYETQKLAAPNDGVIVQLRKKGSWRSALGMSSALTVTLTKQEDNLIADIGAAKWGEKAAVGAAGVLFFPPALITAAYGAWKQSQMPEQVFEIIEQQIQLSQGKIKKEMTTDDAQASVVSNLIACPACKQSIKPDSKFCPNCGAPLKLKCPSCGTDITAGSKFCGNCGSKI